MVMPRLGPASLEKRLENYNPDLSYTFQFACSISDSAYRVFKGERGSLNRRVLKVISETVKQDIPAEVILGWKTYYDNAPDAKQRKNKVLSITKVPGEVIHNFYRILVKHDVAAKTMVSYILNNWSRDQLLKAGETLEEIENEEDKITEDSDLDDTDTSDEEDDTIWDDDPNVEDTGYSERIIPPIEDEPIIVYPETNGVTIDCCNCQYLNTSITGEFCNTCSEISVFPTVCNFKVHEDILSGKTKAI